MSTRILISCELLAQMFYGHFLYAVFVIIHSSNQRTTDVPVLRHFNADGSASYTSSIKNAW